LAKWLAEQTDEVISVAFSADGRAFLSGGSDKTLKLWDIATGREIRTFVGHTDSVIAVAFSPDGRNALSGSSDRTLKFWDVATGKEIRTLAGHTSWARARSTAAACCLAASTTPSSSGTLRRERDSHLAGHTNTVLSVAFCPDGKTALSGSADNTLKLWDVT
jgi:WD40 repeat protein